MGWKPISTAPKDGRHILLYSPKWHWPELYKGNPIAEEENSRIWMGYYGGIFDNADHFIETGMEYSDGPGDPEFWMPLPEPPPC